jgi:hypothetical protein
MDVKDTKLVRVCSMYLHRKDKETAIKKREEQINAMVKTLLIGRTPSQSIAMLKEVVETFDSKLDEELRKSIDNVTAISLYKKIKK